MTEQTQHAGGEPPERTFAWSNMFVVPDQDPRGQGTPTGERETLASFLRDYRLTLEMKCAGLTAAQLATQSVPPSDLSLLGLVRHMSDVERFWFRIVLEGEPVTRRFRTEEDRDASFAGAVGEDAVVAEAWQVWREEMAFADAAAERAEDLGATMPIPGRGENISVRELLVHMIEEYARHCGHADLLRERIDGRVGQ